MVSSLKSVGFASDLSETELTSKAAEINNAPLGEEP